MNTRSFQKILLLVLALFGCLTSALAQTNTVTVPNNFNLSNNNAGVPKVIHQTVPIPQIDHTKFRILGLTISIVAKDQYQSQFFNFTNSSRDAVATGTTTVSIAAPISGTPPASVNNSMFVLGFGISGFGTLTANNLNGLQTSSPSMLAMAPADFAVFYGTGSYNLPLTTTQTSIVSVLGGHSNGDVGTATNVTGSVLVTYHYTTAPVPEPSTLAAVGLGALGFVRRRRALKA